jgi:hypothetical protein
MMAADVHRHIETAGNQFHDVWRTCCQVPLETICVGGSWNGNEAAKPTSKPG